ncbi:MAG TPA: PKD domain-containing protein [Aggregatilinea sp.]|uniref:PKD domain-containing protein n=1 Tax=Aggregatilinea sp. TaxID=2806333 RepID=UPI002CD93DB6|nr:PKD domain-containing protein [Aggregatilinea sp.]HML24436.1 PKD domain-containing protein [Aggregatilinea sp.]
MPNLGGFEVVGELTVGVLNDILKSSWDNDIIPHSVQIPAGTMFGPYALADGVVNIPRDTLSLTMDVPANGVRITLPSEIQVELANPPVPSASMFAMTADIGASVPIGVLPGTIQVAALLNGIPRSSVSATLTSGDPVPPLTLSLIAEYVHARYEDGTIPHSQTQTGIPFGVWTADAFVEIFDDSSNAALRIDVSQPDATHVKVRMPFHLRLSNITASAGPSPLSPMGITGRIALTVELVSAPGTLTARFGSATVAIEDVAPASGSEGTNYTANKTGASVFGIDLEDLLKTQMQARGQAIVTAIGDQVFSVPTVAQIESFIADQAHAAITGRGDISLWTPTPPPGSDVTVTDVRPLALADAIAFCLNNPGGDTSVIVNFIPAGQTCAIAINGDVVIQMIRDQINKPEDEGGFGGLPHTEHNVNGHDAIVHRIDVSLETGHIRIEGDVTVVDAIACVDVDASFSANVGLQWVDNPDGTQQIQPFVIGDPDVDLSLLAWILSFLIGFITLGIVGGVIALVLVAVAESVAENIGGVIVRDEITGQVKGIGAWPQTLEGIGDVTARFDNPVMIDPQSIMFPDAYAVKAIFAETVIAFAESNGPYTVNAGAPITFTGGPVTVDTEYEWDFGDGGTASGRVASHTYADDGIYIAKLKTTVTQPGGVVTRQFARVNARNVPPKVDAGPDMTIDEGQEVEYTAAFTDQEWPDTHTAVFDFGDDTLPVDGTISETNNKPEAKGTTTAKHAYCDNGEYTVTVKVMDDDGGVGIDQRVMTVRNVPPTVDAGVDKFAYPGFPISLEACFTDPGWCDTHTAVWDFGDCTPLTPAVVHETHEPPQGVGVAAAAHVYQHCGTYVARCIVTDDDGGVGADEVIVRVVRLKNTDFEGGFRQRLVGEVANDWEPYGTLPGGERTNTFTPGGAGQLFRGEEIIVHGGQRSQQIGDSRAFRAGLMQSIGANVGWDYQISAWYHLDERGGGVCRLGVDPAGGTDPDAATVVWSQGAEQRDWAMLLVRVTASKRRITVFLESITREERTIAYFDDVELIPYPCPIHECAPEEEPPPPKDQRACVGWGDERKPTRLPDDYEKGGFTFKSRSSMPLMIAFWGDPANQGKLQFPEEGVEIALPFEANHVIARVQSGTSKPIVLTAYDADGKQVGQAASPPNSQGLVTITVEAEGIIRVVISGGGNEGLLIELCIAQIARKPQDKPGKE